jgi:hypothetical protein
VPAEIDPDETSERSLMQQCFCSSCRTRRCAGIRKHNRKLTLMEFAALPANLVTAADTFPNAGEASVNG